MGLPSKTNNKDKALRQSDKDYRLTNKTKGIAAAMTLPGLPSGRQAKSSAKIGMNSPAQPVRLPGPAKDHQPKSSAKIGKKSPVNIPLVRDPCFSDINVQCDLYPDICERHWDKLQSTVVANEGKDNWADYSPDHEDVSMGQLESDLLDLHSPSPRPPSPVSSVAMPIFPPSPPRRTNRIPTARPSGPGESGVNKLCSAGVSNGGASVCGQQVATGAANANPAPALCQIIALLRTLISTLPLGPQAPIISALLDSIVELVQAILGSSSVEAKPVGPTPTLPIPRRTVTPNPSAPKRQAQTARSKAGPAPVQPRLANPAPVRRQSPAPVGNDGFTVVTRRRAPKSYAAAVSGNAGPARGGQGPRVQQTPNPFASAAKKAATSGSRPVVIVRPTAQAPALTEQGTILCLAWQVGLGLSIRDAAAVPRAISCIGANLAGYNCSKKQTRAPRIICFGAAVSRDISTAALEKVIREENDSLFAGKVVPSGIVQSIHWRGPNLVLAASPEFYSALVASTGHKIKMNHLSTRWSLARDSTVCYYCSRLGHIGPNCPEKNSGKACTCTRCAGSHERQQCTAGGERCRNCLDYNQTQARLGRPGRRQANHQATSVDCPSALAFCRRLAERTDFAQLNLGKRQVASSLVGTFGVDVVLCQEVPKYFTNGIEGTTMMASEDFCLVRTHLGTFASLYAHPNDEARREKAFQDLEDAFGIAGRFISGADCNGYSALRGSPLPTTSAHDAQWKIGDDFLATCLRGHGTVLNRPDLFPDPTFVGGQGSSHIDVTVAIGRVPPHEWRLSDEFSGSDHKLLRLTIQDKQPTAPKRLQLRLTNHEKVGEVAASIPDHSSAVEIAATLSEAVAANTPLMEGRDSPSWWSQKLTKLKQGLNKAQKKLQAAKRNGAVLQIEHWQEELLERRRVYRIEVRAAKKRARDRFYASLKDFSSCIRGPKSKSSAAVLNGRPDSNQAEYLLQQLFPRDDDRQRGLDRAGMKPIQPEWVYAVTGDEVLQAIGKLKISAPGSDGVNGEVLKKTAPLLAAKWAEAFTEILRSGEYPAEWKDGKCIALSKPGRDIFTASGWRPVVLLRCASKLLESVIAERLIHSLGEKFRVPEIHGFCRGRSCDTALARIVEAYKDGTSKKGHHTLLLTLDESNAFNSVKHSFLVSELYRLGVPPYLVRTLRSWLTGQQVHLDFGADSAAITLERGVPQGSILGPLLYSISTLSLASLLRPIDDLVSTFYADDKTLVLCTKGKKDFLMKWNRIEDLITLWGKASGLTLSPSKCSYMCRSKLQVPALFIDGGAIPRTKVVKILGLFVDQRLTFATHIRKRCVEARKRIGVLHALGWERAGLDHRRVIRTWHQAVLPFLAHAASIWAPVLSDSPNLSKILDSVSGFVARVAIRAPRSASTAAVTMMAGITPASIMVQTLGARRSAAIGDNEALKKAPGIGPIEGGWLVEQRTPHPLPPWLPPLPTTIRPRKEALKEAVEYTAPAIFTDGSKYEDGAGGAFIAIIDRSAIEKQSFRLPRYATIHQCELEAICRALRWIAFSEHKCKQWRVFTDSQAAILTIKNRVTAERSGIAQDIARLSLLVRADIHWCPGHEGVRWNEEVDVLANIGRRSFFPLDRQPAPHVSTALVKKKAKEAILESTRQWWTDKRRTLGTAVKDFLWGYSHAKRYLKAGKSSPELAAIITGHAPTPHHRHVMGTRADPSCPCGWADGDIKHLLRDCPLLDGARRDSKLSRVMPKANYKMILDRRYRPSLLKMAKLTFEWLKNLREAEAQP
ncbi:hypothetical protein FOL47_010807 [Perkinsus chesapeaki]|uniref:Reverse transcriptase n=1 Tax=Perkinsus chesapeaki TaxID=330153 RepID=A0A7J6L126_PERCH|nr:hypothetical protein FOL47_010807 [Perkinsus chesapeaki]